MEKTNLKGLNLTQLENFFEKIGEKKFRATQMFLWIYNKKAKSFDEMTNLSKKTKTKLDEFAFIENIELVEVKIDEISKTHKFLFRLADGRKIESVLLYDGKRKTICVSSQVGCAVDCKFCATGKMGLLRNLTLSEILDQIIVISRDFETEITNIVFMGMGEPFHNYNNVIESAKILCDPQAFSISQRKITISTSGVLPKIQKFIEEEHNFKLAISLNATDNLTRTALMPLNEKWQIETIFAEIQKYNKTNRNRVTLEYVLLAGINDTDEDAKKLAKWIKDYNCKINVIPYNPTNTDFERPTKERIEKFMAVLGKATPSATLRNTGGRQIQAACGQLATTN
ncbi:23S rRNA (adenine(2503)-C(2))-methyltransferase RlmN [bacterium]|nr:23S rRNA (adenine(2503)-C(2))-methyltransferase RlmN [bacterium]